MRSRWMIVAIAAAGLSGCFNPSVKECGVTCNAARECPSGAVCLNDGFCHNNADETLCAVTFDAAPADAALACGNGIIEVGLGESCDDNNRMNNDGCSDQCVDEAGFVCVDQPSICRAVPATAGDLVITEIMINPAASDDLTGEWFEVFNPTTTDFDLRGMTYSDGATESVMFTDSIVMPSGAHLVFGVTDNGALNGGAPVDVVYGSVPRFGNGTDEIQLLFGATLIDRVSWNAAPNGASLSLSAAAYNAVGNDDIGNLCDGVGVFGDGDTGTPGQMNPACQ